MGLLYKHNKMKEDKIQESESLELKKSTSELDEALISISAILNKHQNGQLYFGIKDDGTVLGQDIGQRTIRDISQAIANKIEPKIYPKIVKVLINNKTCIHIDFSGQDIPYFFSGRAYIRVGDSDRQLSAKGIEKYILEKNKDKLTWDNRISDKKLSDININALKNYIIRANNAKRIDFEFKNVKSALVKLGLLKNNKLLNVAEILFCDNNNLKIQAALFAGTTKTEFLDIKSFKGNLFDLLKKSEEYVSEHINWRAEIKEFKREEIPEIPLAALREAIVNSLCHRDYTRADSNKIAIFKDRVKIYNPGSFPRGLNPEDFIKRDIESFHRNPLISDLLYYSQDIERWGTGLKRIHNECKAKKVKVVFNKETEGFSVIFFRNKQFELLKKEYKDIPSMILELCKESKKRSEIFNQLGLSNQTKNFEAYIKPLINEGKLRLTIPKKPNSKNQRYSLTKKGILFLKSKIK